MKKILLFCLSIFFYSINASQPLPAYSNNKNLIEKRAAQKEINLSFTNAAKHQMKNALEKAYKKGADLGFIDENNKNALQYAIDNKNEDLIKTIINFNPNIICASSGHYYAPLAFYSPLKQIAKNVFDGKLSIDFFEKILNSFPFNIRSLRQVFMEAFIYIFGETVFKEGEKSVRIPAQFYYDRRANKKLQDKHLNLAIAIMDLLLKKENKIGYEFLSDPDQLIYKITHKNKTILDYAFEQNRYDIIALILKIAPNKYVNYNSKIRSLEILTQKVLNNELHINFLEYILQDVNFHRSFLNKVLINLIKEKKYFNNKNRTAIFELFLQNGANLLTLLRSLYAIEEDLTEELNFINKYIPQYLDLYDPQIDKIIAKYKNENNKKLLINMIENSKRNRMKTLQDVLEESMPKQIVDIIAKY